SPAPRGSAQAACILRDFLSAVHPAGVRGLVLPSGPLEFGMNELTRITPKPNGPLVVEGPVRIVTPDGRELPVPPRKDGRPAEVVVLCRCGGGAGQPLFDGTHKDDSFSAPPPPGPAPTPYARETMFSPSRAAGDRGGPAAR